MEQQRALNALEPYLALSRSASSPRAAADLVVQATSAPQTFVFAELLQKPNIQALSQSPEYVAHLKLLEIFAWGTYAEYKATPNLPSLNANQQQKLLLLSLLPLCSSPATLSYKALQASLSLPTPRDLEVLVTTAIYAGLLQAHIDPLKQKLNVTSVAPLRDLEPGSVPSMVGMLDEWQIRCDGTLAEIEAEVASIRTMARDERSREARHEAMFDDQMERLTSRDRREGLSDSGGQSAKRGQSSRWGSLLSGRGPKRSAPQETYLTGTPGNHGDDVMDVDDGDGAAKLGNRSTKRKGPR